MLSLFRFVPGKFMLENLRNFPINTGSKIYRVNLLRHIYFLNFIKGYFTFCTVNPIRIIFKTLVYIFCISVILTSVISVWGQLSESLLRNHWINHAWRLSTHIACIFSVICAQRKWISPVGSVGASAAQRCPPDTRTPWGTYFPSSYTKIPNWEPSPLSLRDILAQPLCRRCRHFPILWGITHTVGSHLDIRQYACKIFMQSDVVSPCRGGVSEADRGADRQIKIWLCICRTIFVR